MWPSSRAPNARRLGGTVRRSRRPTLLRRAPRRDLEQDDEQAAARGASRRRGDRPPDATNPPAESLAFMTVLKGLRCKSFHEFMSHVRETHGDTTKVNLWPVLPPVYLMQGKAANRAVLFELDDKLRQVPCPCAVLHATRDPRADAGSALAPRPDSARLDQRAAGLCADPVGGRRPAAAKSGRALPERDLRQRTHPHVRSDRAGHARGLAREVRAWGRLARGVAASHTAHPDRSCGPPRANSPSALPA